ncbi:MAG: DNA integrity scanning protein DisA nucleotide-binding domain protein [Erysipelotrichaceae bacterium]|jgi:diadenylate cyclase|nr:DNA integrity scanning protein DisA nucleotide-binding domain protein [Erysipelotrichaceae bacterium]
MTYLKLPHLISVDINNFSFNDFWLPLIMITIVVIGILIIFSLVIKKSLLYIYYAIFYALFLVGLLLDDATTENLAIVFLGIGVPLFVTMNIASFRVYFTSSLKASKRTKKRASFIDKKDQEAFYQLVSDTVFALAKTKTGAILTFLKRTPLSDVLRSGTTINAPFSEELVLTIFHEGTRLHDGAMIINGKTILAASVYFTLTNSPMSGKFGSRHRAALGISEVSDAVTVVISEETGRVSIAVNGELIGVNQTNFLSMFLRYLEDE